MSKRLDAIVRMAPKVEMAADIGCDHGKIGVALLLTGKAQRVIFSDISAKSLEKTRKLICTEALEGRSSLRVGNGLDVLENEEADAVIIAGIGGELISKILDEGKEKAPYALILSCNTKPEILRLWLCGNGYVIEDEDIIFEDGRFYPVMMAIRGESRELGDMELELGPVLLKKKPEVLKRLIDVKIANAAQNRESVIKFGTQSAKEKLSELDEKINNYEEVRRCLLQ